MNDESKKPAQPEAPPGVAILERIMGAGGIEVVDEMMAAIGGHDELKVLLGYLGHRFMERRREAAAKCEGDAETLGRTFTDAMVTGFLLARDENKQHQAIRHAVRWCRNNAAEVNFAGDRGNRMVSVVVDGMEISDRDLVSAVKSCVACLAAEGEEGGTE